ncbi:trans-sulfuration enzyme family protein [Gallaecimonas mangrovi]|uniref:trans-sulfuration enzyme family protein n=1 Tax=Gallaecimonas mangrovi TaxID=2291597 RepID=UPI000E20361D|nr:aminotransferase class I/II-fold pyridoxal phosphate-dependent enzyme [Gallaecimonas mangrovi]
MRKKTALIHGQHINDPMGSISPPIYQSSSFTHIGNESEFRYSRGGNPTRQNLEELIAHLEGGDRGFAFATGMAAITTVMMMLKSGDELVVCADIYGGTFRVIEQVLSQMNVAIRFVDASNVEAVRQAVSPKTKMLYVETPSNPLLKITDIAAMAEIAKAHQIPLVADNTFATPYWQNPLAHGADIVIHSATKYLGGHSDLMAGLVVTRDDIYGKRVKQLQNTIGAVLGPQDSFLLIRGIRTLGLRMEAIEANTRVLADWLQAHPAVKKIYYPGFAETADKAVHEKQCSGYGGVISIELASQEKAEEMAKRCRYFVLADSLGAVESMLNISAQMSHGSFPVKERLALGITDSLVRLSVGIEDVEDLKEDLAQALA